MLSSFSSYFFNKSNLEFQFSKISLKLLNFSLEKSVKIDFSVIKFFSSIIYKIFLSSLISIDLYIDFNNSVFPEAFGPKITFIPPLTSWKFFMQLTSLFLELIIFRLSIFISILYFLNILNVSSYLKIS